MFYLIFGAGLQNVHIIKVRVLCQNFEGNSFCFTLQADVMLFKSYSNSHFVMKTKLFETTTTYMFRMNDLSNQTRYIRSVMIDTRHSTESGSVVPTDGWCVEAVSHLQGKQCL